ncbi:hypothetical protein FKP32DRAFT_1557005, partial [Trametes sanguinea]
LSRRDFLTVFKKVYADSLLPQSLDTKYNHILVRILRVIGGISVLLVLSHTYTKFSSPLDTIILYLAMLQTTQIFIISMIKFINGIYTLVFKPKFFEIRNSPLRRNMIHLYKIFYCAKVGCEVAATASGLVAGALILDEVRVNAGQDRIVLPWLTKVYREVY